MFFECRALKLLLLAAAFFVSPTLLGDPDTPCCPNLIVFTLSPAFATTTWDFLGCFGVLLGLLKPDTPTLFKAGCFFFLPYLPLRFLPAGIFIYFFLGGYPRWERESWSWRALSTTFSCSTIFMFFFTFTIPIPSFQKSLLISFLFYKYKSSVNIRRLKNTNISVTPR